MLESYTDEEIAEARQSYLSKIENIWGEKTGEYAFYIRTSNGYLLTIYGDGETLPKDLSGEHRTSEYIELYPQLGMSSTSIFLKKSNSLKEHLVELIKDRGSLIFEDWKELYDRGIY